MAFIDTHAVLLNAGSVCIACPLIERATVRNFTEISGEKNFMIKSLRVRRVFGMIPSRIVYDPPDPAEPAEDGAR